MDIARLTALCGALWAIGALAAQLRGARGGGRGDHSRRSGRPGRGLAYNFTIAMLPRHKESIRHHPVEFAIGAVMHVAVLATLAGVLLVIANPETGRTVLAAMRPLLLLGLAAGLALVVRRLASRDLRSMSVPDDYVAIGASCLLLAAGSLAPVHRQTLGMLLGYATLLFLYFPLGKLRHAVFFFAARADYGRRLGYRGVYPPHPARSE